MKRKESPSRAWRRACRQHAALAIAYLRDARRPDAIHRARREIKRMRALLRLIRGLAGRKEYRSVLRVMCLAPKPLAASRDALAASNVFAGLVGSNARQFPELAARLQISLRQAERDVQEFDSRSVAIYLLNRARHKLAGRDLKRFGWPELLRRLEGTHRRGRLAYVRAMRHLSPENSHEWRKRVKDLSYQLNFLCPNWPPGTRALMTGLQTLGDHLGHDHDLFLLEQFGRQQCDAGPETVAVQKLIDARRKQIRAAVRQLGDQLFGPAPKAALAGVERDWKAWRKAKAPHRKDASRGRGAIAPKNPA